jgi:hypothetical protein
MIIVGHLWRFLTRALILDRLVLVVAPYTNNDDNESINRWWHNGRSALYKENTHQYNNIATNI